MYGAPTRTPVVDPSSGWGGPRDTSANVGDTGSCTLGPAAITPTDGPPFPHAARCCLRLVLDRSRRGLGGRARKVHRCPESLRIPGTPRTLWGGTAILLGSTVPCPCHALPSPDPVGWGRLDCPHSTAQRGTQPPNRLDPEGRI